MEEIIHTWKRSREPSRGTGSGTSLPHLYSRMSLLDRSSHPFSASCVPFQKYLLGGNRCSPLLPFPWGGGLHQSSSSGLTLSSAPDWRRRRHPVSTFWTSGARPSRPSSSLDWEVGVSPPAGAQFPLAGGAQGLEVGSAVGPRATANRSGHKSQLSQPRLFHLMTSLREHSLPVHTNPPHSRVAAWRSSGWLRQSPQPVPT